MISNYHTPVLARECLEGLNIKPGGTYVDTTYGGGGHSRAILEKLGPAGRLVVFDQDEDATANQITDERVIFVRHNFKFLYHFLKYLDAIPVDGILADIGVSSHHFDNAGRGFSYRFDEPLDMRMNRATTLTAANVLNSYTEEQLCAIFKDYGELPVAKPLSREIIVSRNINPVTTTGELKKIALRFAPRVDTNRFLSRVFQALRIEVNQEIEVLKDMLSASIEVLKPGGRIAVISYHSLEDRLVKSFFKTGNFSGLEPEADLYGNREKPFKIITRKVIVPDQSEIEQNPRARSARLRIAEKP